MQVKILSVVADKSFRDIKSGFAANAMLESEIQGFLDENPDIEIKHLQFSTISVSQANPEVQTSDSLRDREWKAEKSVLLMYESKT